MAPIEEIAFELHWIRVALDVFVVLFVTQAFIRIMAMFGRGGSTNG